jgi:hypothetical protein
LEASIKTQEKALKDMETRIEEVEAITEQLNDTSTQQDTPQVSHLQK